MTNTLTYSIASFGSFPPEFTPRFHSDRVAHLLDNLACTFRKAQDAVIDNSAMFMVGGVVAGMFSMAVAIGLGLRG